VGDLNRTICNKRDSRPWEEPGAAWGFSKFSHCDPLLSQCTFGVDGAFRGAVLSESLENFSVAVVAVDDGRFAYQVYLVCSEPCTLLTDSARY
jgi:hypothetical protein